MEDLTKLRALTTEGVNQRASALHTKSALEIAEIINAEDRTVPLSVGKALPLIARVIDDAADAIGGGGRLIYVGAGTSGRLGALDASECPPTFGVSYETVQYVMAGGPQALGAASEASEDSRELGERDMAARNPNPKDLVIGIAASGRTPYTVAAVQYARNEGARTGCVVCNLGSPLAAVVELPIEVEVGPEVVSGSSRMKAGTAQKLVLNMITTAAFTRLGYVYDNLMVNVKLSNAKLLERGVSILQRILGASREQAEQALHASELSVPVALLMLKFGDSPEHARERLNSVHGHVGKALDSGS
ncbi:MAG TPA: N-acetylmuramic acid 6-phosphate etherase [Terriglobales bacterium]